MLMPLSMRQVLLKTWSRCTLGYSGRKIAATGTGTGGLSEVLSSLDDSAITYALIRLSKTDDGGDSKRVKFVFLTWCVFVPYIHTYASCYIIILINFVT